MNSLFDQQYVEGIIERINKLSPGLKPLWGKMNTAQMLAHCTAPLQMAHGEIQGKRGLIGFLFGKMIKKKYLQGAEFEKNLPTDPKFIFPDVSDFDKEKQRLINKLREFAKKGPDAITKGKHSFFGAMTPHEWDVIQSKHLDHHLRQFGV
jgi:hypothetical protein